MEGRLQVPSNIDNPTVLRRYLTSLASNWNNNPLLSGQGDSGEYILDALQATNSSLSFLTSVAENEELRNSILGYVQQNIQTVIKQNSDDISVISEQFGTFYQQALAASWYGLNVKAGGAIAGLEIGSLDPDVTTPGDEESFFRIIADNFLIGRAYEDMSQEEKDYIDNNNLPRFGTAYNAQGLPIPAMLAQWNNVEKLYEIFFNGIVEFNHVRDETTGDTLSATLSDMLTQIKDSKETADGVVKCFFSNDAPTTGMDYGDWWVDTNSNPTLAYRYEDENGDNESTMVWYDNTKSNLAVSFIAAASQSGAGDGLITVYYYPSEPIEAEEGDIWINTTNRSTTTRKYNGNEWITIDVSKSINAGTTTIDGGMVKAATMDANRLASGRIVNSAALRTDGTINESAVTMDINLNEGSIWIK